MAKRSGTGVVLFTRDLRVHDNPVLHGALERHERIVPLFVLDTAILRGDYNAPNRAAFLAGSLADLDASLRDRGAGLVVRRGDLAREVRAVAADVGADEVHVAQDCSGYAHARARRLRDALDGVAELHEYDDALFVVPPGAVTATGKNHMAVFTPYHRKWSQVHRRKPFAAPRAVAMPRIARGSLPKPKDICPGTPSPELPDGGETAGRDRLAGFVRSDASSYTDNHDDMAADRTSRLSPYLHFGCVSPVEAVTKASSASDFVRQVCWRDFHAQVLAARPDATRQDYRTRDDRWRHPEKEFDAWRTGMTGYPLVDAGMRQLEREGWMHNRARLVTANFLTKTMYVDWRLGAQHFIDLLVDGDTANNTMNWQWCAGTGTDSRFNRVYSVTTQANRYDPDGSYVRRYVPELAALDGAAIHEPWKLADDERRKLDYPEPIVDNAEGNKRFLHARGKR